MPALDKSIIGKKFNMLTVLDYDHSSKKSGTYWLCLCDCGNTTIVSKHNLNNLSIVSCGCYKNSGFQKDLAYEDKKGNIGRKYNMLTILDYEPGKGYFCSCDCGNFCYAKETDLTDGSTKSCGCFRRKRLPLGESAFRRIYDNYRRKAKNNGLDFDISREEFREITQQNCYYCGECPSQRGGAVKREYGDYIYNGIDRLDNSKGYTLNNSVPCCGFCNVAKNDYSEKYFIGKMISIYYNLKSKGKI